MGILRQVANTSRIFYFIAGVSVSIFFFVLRYNIQKPKLVFGGGGSGGISTPDEDIVATDIQLYNSPTFLGFRIERSAAKIVSARLYDLKDRVFIGPTLRWRTNAGGFALAGTAEIEAGGQSTLYLFAKIRHANSYFVYAASATNEKYYQPDMFFSDRKKWFRLDLRDSIGRIYRFKLQAVQSGQGVRVLCPMTLANRYGLIVDAFNQLRIAIFTGWLVRKK